MADVPKGLRAFWRLNRGSRLLALLLAIIVWYAIREATSFETTIENVPITVLHDDGLAVLDLSDDGTDVRFAGARSDIRDLARHQVQVVVDARGPLREGRQAVPIGPANVRAPRGCRPVFVRAEQVSFSLDRESLKTVPVKVDVQGTPPPGYEIDRFVCIPATAQLRGPTSQLEAVDFVRTAPIDLEGRLQSFQVRRNLLVPGPAWAVRVDPDRVQVEAIVVERSTTRTFERLPVRVMAAAGERIAAAVSPATATVVVRGRTEALNELSPDAVQPFVDVARLAARARYDLPVRIHTTAPVRIVSVDPSSVTVEIGEGLRP